MKKVFLSVLCTIAVFTVQAQTDVTEHFLSNAGFNEGFSSFNNISANNIPGDQLLDISGWNKDMGATYTVSGIIAYGSGLKVNGSNAVPAKGYLNSEGGALALSTGWGMSLKYYQSVTLPKGNYSIVSVYYNAASVTLGSALTGWVPDGSGQSALSTVTSFSAGTWIVDTINFTLSATTTGRIQVGFKAGDGGSANSAKVLVDYVKILFNGVDKTVLNTKITEAETAYNVAAIGADLLLAAIESAKAVNENNDADMASVLTATNQLGEVLLDYQLTNATITNPLNFTSYIVNPSFESGFNGWTNGGMATQTNTVFPRKNGTTYIEKWVNIGSKIPNVSVEQQLTDIPNGKYILTAATGNIQQSGSGSTVNSSKNPQTGVTLFAGFNTVAVDTIKDRSVNFVVIDNKVTIGLKALNATGNWLTCDNFRLQYIGKNTDADYAEYLRSYIAEAQNLLTKKVQNSVKSELEAAITQAQQAIDANPLVPEALSTAKETLETVFVAVEASMQLYDNLQIAIDYAEKVKDWYKEDQTKKDKMQTAINSANVSLNNFDLTVVQINKAVSDLQTITKSVDKKIYVDSWALGDPNNNNNAWSYQRSKQSRNWIVFWEKGYGDDINSLTCGNFTLNIDALLNVAEKSFDYYTDSLKFIKRGSSKTDQYKMVIRVRYTTDWEASGSGVAETIGLLTLTAWSANNPGHTVAHEAAHCFQYQVRCDSGGKNNGWRYGFGGQAGNGWWEQCAQWQGFKIYPAQQFTDGRFTGYMNTVHKHILHEAPRYDNYFIQDYWVYLHGLDFIGRLWNESQYPEDPVETYKRINGITQSQFNDEMYDCATRFATWDIPHLKSYGANYINSRPQPAMTKTTDDAWIIAASVCPENYGHNIIKLNAPSTATRVSVYFEGKAGIDGYRKNYTTQAGWRYGFVALLKNGTRVYSDMGTASYTSPNGNVHFDCPANCDKLWLIVSGAPNTHWQHAWDDNDNNDEQWAYQVRFNNTNRLGSVNMTYSSVSSEIEDNIKIYAADRTLSINQLSGYTNIRVFNATGQSILNIKTNETMFSTELPTGIYIVNISVGNKDYSRKVVIK